MYFVQNAAVLQRAMRYSQCYTWIANVNYSLMLSLFLVAKCRFALHTLPCGRAGNRSRGTKRERTGRVRSRDQVPAFRGPDRTGPERTGSVQVHSLISLFGSSATPATHAPHASLYLHFMQIWSCLFLYSTYVHTPNIHTYIYVYMYIFRT